MLQPVLAMYTIHHSVMHMWENNKSKKFQHFFHHLLLYFY
jgi:hypothetical protein